MMESFYLLVLLFLSVSAKLYSCGEFNTDSECSLAFIYHDGEIEGNPKYGCYWGNGSAICVNADTDYCENLPFCGMPCMKVNDKCIHSVDVESCSDLMGYYCKYLYTYWPSSGLKCVNVEGTCSDLLVNCTSITNKEECLEYPQSLSCVWTNLSEETGSNCIDISSVTSCSVIEAAGEDTCYIFKNCSYLSQSQKCVSSDSLTSCSDLEGSHSCINFKSFPNVETSYGCIFNEESDVCTDATETTCENYGCSGSGNDGACFFNGNQCVNILGINSCDEILEEEKCLYPYTFYKSPNFEDKDSGCFWNNTQGICQTKSGNCSEYDYKNCQTYPSSICLWNGEEDEEDKCVSIGITCGDLTTQTLCEREIGYLACVWKEESCQELDCGEFNENSCKNNSYCLFDGNDCKSFITSSIQRCNQINYENACTSAYNINLFCDWKNNSDSTGGYCCDEDIEFSCDFLLSDESCRSFEECFYLDGSCVSQEDLYFSCFNLSSTLCTNETITEYLETESFQYGCKLFNGKCVISYPNCSQITKSEQCSLSKSELGIPTDTDTNVVCAWVVEGSESKCEEYTDECRAFIGEEDCTSDDCFWNSNACVSKEWITNCAQISVSSLCTDDGNTFENLTDGPCLWLVSGDTNNGICKVKQSLEGPQEILSKDQCTSQFINENFLGTTNIIYVWNSESDTVTTESGKQPCKKKRDLYSCILIERESLCVDDNVQCSWEENKCISKPKEPEPEPEPEPEEDSTSVPRLSAFVVLVSITLLFMLF